MCRTYGVTRDKLGCVVIRDWDRMQLMLWYNEGWIAGRMVKVDEFDDNDDNDN